MSFKNIRTNSIRGHSGTMTKSSGERIKPLFQLLVIKASHWSVCAVCKWGRLRQILNLSAIFFPQKGKKETKASAKITSISVLRETAYTFDNTALSSGEEKRWWRRWREYQRAAPGSDAAYRHTVEGRRRWENVVGGGGRGDTDDERYPELHIGRGKNLWWRCAQSEAAVSGHCPGFWLCAGVGGERERRL